MKPRAAFPPRVFFRCGSVSLLVVGLFVSGAGPARAQAPGPDLAMAARFAAEHCGSCHGNTGQSAAASFPRLAGQNEAYLVKQLGDFASGQRKSPMMKEKVALMGGPMIRALAAFYARQPAANTPSGDTQLMAVGQYVYERGNVYTGLPACASCHGALALGTNDLPRLAGQHPAYITVQLQRFHQSERSNDGVAMKFVSSRMSELETQAVATYLGNLR